MGLILYISSIILMAIAIPFEFFRRLFQSAMYANNYYLLKAIQNDKLSNVEHAELLTNLFLTHDSQHSFGKDGETISSVLGKNLQAGTLTKQGIEICNLLDFFQPNHVINSIQK